MTRAEILQRARKHIEYGWCQAFYEVGNNCCAMGAVRRVTHDPIERAIIERILSQLCRVKGYGSIFIYNDTLGRKKEDILVIFDEAIRSAQF